MRLNNKKWLASCIVASCIFVAPLSVVHAITLSSEARSQLGVIATQLSQILQQLATAQAQGVAYVQSAFFQAQAVLWTQQVALLANQLTSVIGSAVNTQSYQYGIPAYQTQYPANQYTQSYQYSPFQFTNSYQQYQYAQTPYSRYYSTTPSGTSYSTGALAAQAVSGASNYLVNFVITANPNTSCSASTFTLAFGDGQNQTLTFPASCATQTQALNHIYPSATAYTATLSSGSFSVSASIQASTSTSSGSSYTGTGSSNGGSVSISAAAGTSNYSVIVTATAYPGPNCLSSSYTLDYGDGTTQAISFNGSCSSQTQTFSHAYSQVQSYTIRAFDPSTYIGSTVSFTPSRVISEGQGNPFTVLSINIATSTTSIVDTSSIANTINNSGAVISTTTTASLYLNGSSYIYTSAKPDFNFGSNAFTVEMWIKPSVLPGADQQAALIMQADNTGVGSSMGGAGLEIVGGKLAFVGRIGSVTYHPWYNNTVMSTSTLSVGVWHHVAVVRSGNIVNLYLNGLSQGSITVSGSANNSTANMTVGRYGDLANNYFNGWIDGVSIQNGSAKWLANFAISTIPAP